MHAAPARTVSFFEYATSDRGSRRTGAFLDRMQSLIPWAEISEKLTPALYDGQTGRPGFPVTVLVKALLLESWYNLSDPELEEQILDRLSFQRFLEVSDRKDIPDETTVCRFRQKLVDIGACEDLFGLVQALIEREGVEVKHGTIVDATIIDAPKGRKRSDGSSTRDTDAGFTKKNGDWRHGYKAHTATDTSGRFIRRVIVTSASVHDADTFDDLTSGEGQAVFADKAYISEEKKRDFRRRGILWGVLDRASRNHPLSRRQERRNRQKSSVRSHVEHPFAWMKRLMGYRRSRYRGLLKNTAHAFLITAAYNLKRLDSVLRMEAAHG
jgi:transposase, IS5 family